MQEISEMQALNRKDFAHLSVVNFKHLLFRYRVLHKLNQLTKLTKDSVDFRSLKT
jgi:RIO-like serine/threonine protein kinase